VAETAFGSAMPCGTDGVRKIAKRFGVNASTVQGISREIVVG